MRKGGGKAKGAEFERQICVKLSLWVTDGERKDVFWRSAMSGGRATVRGEDVRQAGDICAVSREGHDFCDRFYLECKHYKDLAIDRMLICNSGVLSDFWATTAARAKKRGQEPLLIAKQNQYPTLVLSLANAFMTMPILITYLGIDFYYLDNLLDTPYAQAYNGRLASERQSTGLLQARVRVQRPAQAAQTKPGRPADHPR